MLLYIGQRGRDFCLEEGLSGPESHSIIVARVAFLFCTMRNAKTKLIILGIVLSICLISIFAVQVIHNRRVESMERRMIAQRIDSLQADAMKKYQEVLERRDQKADSIIREINSTRKLQGKPLLNMRLEGWLDKSHPLYDEHFDMLNDVHYIGACHYDSFSETFSSAILLNLYRPDMPVYLSLHNISKDKFMGVERDKHRWYDVRLMDEMLFDRDIRRNRIK